MSGRVIGFIVLTAILAIARAAPEDAETYVTAIGDRSTLPEAPAR